VRYAPAYERQCHELERIVALRDDPSPDHPLGVILLVEHEPVITVSRRPTAAGNVVATPAHLARAGVELAETDRGGDVTYHGPGQLVVYPILDLNALHLRLHDYMRLLEQSVIDTCAAFGVASERDPSATGVWVRSGDRTAKVAAMGVRVRRWVSMHGLALNVTTNLDHFNLIVPCGLIGRPVTSLHQLLGERCPSMDQVKHELVAQLRKHLLVQRDRINSVPSV
jgi:lipoyl(octanoyl) transferase